jgi:hypothetical protein
MSGKFFFSWCLRFCTWVSVGGRFLFFSLMFENLLLDDLDQKRKKFWCLFLRDRDCFSFFLDVWWPCLDDLDQRESLVSSPFFLKVCLLFFWNGGRLFSFLLDVWWSCLDDLDLKRKVGLPPFFWKVFVFFFFLERLIVWRRCLSFALIFWGSSVLMISIGKERFFFFFGVMFQSEVRTFSLSWFLRIFLDDLDH